MGLRLREESPLRVGVLDSLEQQAQVAHHLVGVRGRLQRCGLLVQRIFAQVGGQQSRQTVMIAPPPSLRASTNDLPPTAHRNKF
jgi:hypothetical protein